MTKETFLSTIKIRLLEVLVHETKKYEDEPDDGNLMTFN